MMMMMKVLWTSERRVRVFRTHTFGIFWGSCKIKRAQIHVLEDSLTPSMSSKLHNGVETIGIKYGNFYKRIK